MTAAEVAQGLGGALQTGSQWLARCPVHADRTPSLALRDGDGGRLLVHCFAGCVGADVWGRLRQLGLAGTFSTERNLTPLICRGGAPNRAKPGRKNLSRGIWSETVVAPGTIVEVYLRHRRLGLPAGATCIRYHPRCPRGADRLPAMVAEMRDAVTDEFVGVHRTFLKPDGTGKAEVEPQRMALGVMAGAVIKVSPDTEVGLGLGICEGIEDAIAILNAGWSPVWSCISAGNLGAFPLIDGVEALTVFADADQAGAKAARRTVSRWQRAGRQARIALPKRAKDFDEVLQ